MSFLLLIEKFGEELFKLAIIQNKYSSLLKLATKVFALCILVMNSLIVHLIVPLKYVS